MPAAIRSYVTAGVALVGASVISVTPVVPNLATAQQDVRSVSLDVELAAQSVANIGPNLINMFLNMPMAQVDAVNYFAESWAQSGNWWVLSQDNILGWDRANPAMSWSMVDLLLPFPALSKPLGQLVQWWMAANLPMNSYCSALPPCNDSTGMLNSMFRVPVREFYSQEGYTFGLDGYTPKHEPVSANESYWGYELGEDGDKVPWYGQTVKLDPLEVWNSLIDYLLEDPEEVRFPTLSEVVTAVTKFGETLKIMFYPFVPQSYIWNPRYSDSANLFRPFSKVLCPSCNEYDPFMPPGWVPEDGFPAPVNDGWTDDGAKTPTGLPLPTTSVGFDGSLLSVAADEGGETVDSEVDLTSAQEPIESEATDALATDADTVEEQTVDTTDELPGDVTEEEQDALTTTDDETDVEETASLAALEHDKDTAVSLSDSADTVREESNQAEDSADPTTNYVDSSGNDSSSSEGAGSEGSGSEGSD